MVLSIKYSNVQCWQYQLLELRTNNNTGSQFVTSSQIHSVISICRSTQWNLWKKTHTYILNIYIYSIYILYSNHSLQAHTLKPYVKANIFFNTPLATHCCYLKHLPLHLELKIKFNEILNFLKILQWRQNERNGVTNHRRLHCLLSCLFTRVSKKTSKLCITGLWERNSPVAGECPAQRASNAENDVIMRKRIQKCGRVKMSAKHRNLVLILRPGY